MHVCILMVNTEVDSLLLYGSFVLCSGLKGGVNSGSCIMALTYNSIQKGLLLPQGNKVSCAASLHFCTEYGQPKWSVRLWNLSKQDILLLEHISVSQLLRIFSLVINH